MKTILVTGGAGFIGSNFVRHVKGAHPDYSIINLDKLTYAGNLENLKSLEGESGYTFIKGDICDRGLVDEIFKKYSIDTVVNFAAESHVDRSILGPEEFIRTNIMGTFVLLEAARRYWQTGSNDTATSKNLFVHVSTDEVYGSLGEEGLFTEETPYAPNSPYSASKASSDHLARAYFKTYGLPTITTNCSNNYGPYQFPEKLIPLMIINALNEKPLPVYGDGKNVRDWIYVEDHCSAIDSVVHSGKSGEVYNIGGGNEWQNTAIVRLICELVESKLGLPAGDRKRLIEFVKDRPGHDRRYAMDSSKIKKELGWAPRHTFRQGIEKTVDWYLDNRNWWERILSGEYMEYYKKQYEER